MTARSHVQCRVVEAGGPPRGARAELEVIDRALERLRAGTYGTCTRCGGEITGQRLVALPVTSTLYRLRTAR